MMQDDVVLVSDVPANATKTPIGAPATAAKPAAAASAAAAAKPAIVSPRAPAKPAAAGGGGAPAAENDLASLGILEDLDIGEHNVQLACWYGSHQTAIGP